MVRRNYKTGVYLRPTHPSSSLYSVLLDTDAISIFVKATLTLTELWQLIRSLRDHMYVRDANSRVIMSLYDRSCGQRRKTNLRYDKL